MVDLSGKANPSRFDTGLSRVQIIPTVHYQLQPCNSVELQVVIILTLK